MANKIWRTLVRTAAAACFVVGSSAQAGGVFYASDFDPLGFAGTAKWYVDDNCRGSDGTLANGYHAANLFAPGGCDVALASLKVTLWNGGASSLKDAKTDNDPSIVSKDFANEFVDQNPYGIPIANPVLVAGFWVVNHELAGVDTFLIGPEFMTNTDPNLCLGSSSVTCDVDGYYGVQFTSGNNWLVPFAPLLETAFPAIGNLRNPGAYLWEKNSDSPPCATPVGQFWWATFTCASEVAVTDNNTDGYAPFMKSAYAPYGFSYVGTSFDGPTVPEPGSLALLGGALVAGWITRRRKAAA
jgi:hypothetical protein